MKSSFYLIFLFTFIFAQPDVVKQQESMQKLNWLTGEWHGSAYTNMGPTKKDTVKMKESICFKLDGTILQIEGLGFDNKTNTEIVHNAFALISFDDKTGEYIWQSWRLPGGYHTKCNPVVKNNWLQWFFDTPRGKIRYTLNITAEGKWYEIGEFQKDENNWVKFFEMELTKI